MSESNKTRLDSLSVGERFAFTEGGEAYVSKGADFLYPLAVRARREVATRGTSWDPYDGDTYVIPLDPPPPIPEA